MKRDPITAPPDAEVESLRKALVERDLDVGKLRRDVRNRDMEIARLDASHADLRARLARIEPVIAKAQQWRLYPSAQGAIAELKRAIDAALAAEKEQG